MIQNVDVSVAKDDMCDSNCLCDCLNTVLNADLTPLCKVESIIVALPLFLDLFTDSTVQSEIDHRNAFLLQKWLTWSAHAIDHLFVNS